MLIYTCFQKKNPIVKLGLNPSVQRIKIFEIIDIYLPSLILSIDHNLVKI